MFKIHKGSYSSLSKMNGLYIMRFNCLRCLSGWVIFKVVTWTITYRIQTIIQKSKKCKKKKTKTHSSNTLWLTFKNMSRCIISSSGNVAQRVKNALSSSNEMEKLMFFNTGVLRFKLSKPYPRYSNEMSLGQSTRTKFKCSL
jgi:hypothetical protein